MKSFTLIAILIFFLSMLGVLAYNASGQADALFELKPVYSFAPGDWLSYFNAFFFVFFVSLLFFGIGGVVAMLLEGLKYGTMLSQLLLTTNVTGVHVFDLLFAVPQLLACIAATTLGAGLILDYRGKATVYPYWRYAVRYFLIGLIMTLALAALRTVLVPLL